MGRGGWNSSLVIGCLPAYNGVGEGSFFGMCGSVTSCGSVTLGLLLVLDSGITPGILGGSDMMLGMEFILATWKANVPLTLLSF